MNIDQLGISQETLVNMVVDKIASSILDSRIEGDDFSSHVELQFEKRVGEQVKKAIEQGIEKVIGQTTQDAIENAVRTMVDSTTFTETSRYGEPKKPPITWREMLVSKAEHYLSEPVDSDGKPKGQGGYDSRYDATRAAWLIYRYMGKELHDAAAKMLANANAQIVGGMKKAIEQKLSEITVSLTAPR